MYHPEPDAPKRLIGRNSLFVPLFIAALAGCNKGAPEPSSNAQVQAPATPAAPRLPTRVPALSRSDLISASASAASAYAAGETLRGDDPLDGRTFSIRIAFGCSGPAPTQPAATEPPDASDAAGLARWSWGADRKSIDLTMTPGDWSDSALIAGSGEVPDWEAVEGFWITRPWLASDACPNASTDPLQTTDAAASPQTLGLAAIFEEGGSRLGRRDGRAYAYTVRAEDDAPLVPPSQGYHLVLEGRIAAYPDGRAFRCRAPSPDQRPVCVVAAKLDRVAFEGEQGKVLSEWRPG